MYHLTQAFWVSLLSLSDLMSSLTWMENRRTGLRKEQRESRDEYMRVSWYRGREETGYDEQCGFGACPPKENYRRVGFAEKGCSKEIGKHKNPRKQSFHPNVREVTWQPATTPNWVQQVHANSEIQDSFFSTSFAPHLHYLTSEIMRSHTIKYFGIFWQMAS